MNLLIRLYEKLTGTPHQLQASDRVHAAADRLKHSIDDLSLYFKDHR